MAIVLRWKDDGKYLRAFEQRTMMDGRLAPVFSWSERQRDAMRFANRADAMRQIEAHLGRPPQVIHEESSFVRLIPRKRHASPQP